MTKYYYKLMAVRVRRFLALNNDPALRVITPEWETIRRDANEAMRGFARILAHKGDAGHAAHFAAQPNLRWDY